MRRNFKFFVVFVCFAMLSSFQNVSAIVFKESLYKKTETKMIELKSEDFRNKKIFYESKYFKIQTLFPHYADKSGIKSDKYYWLVMTPKNFPVLLRKNKYKQLDELLVKLKGGEVLKVYGKVKKMKYKPRLGTSSQYYLELIHFEIIKQAEKKQEENIGNGKKLPILRRNRRFRRR